MIEHRHNTETAWIGTLRRASDPASTWPAAIHLALKDRMEAAAVRKARDVEALQGGTKVIDARKIGEGLYQI